MIEDLRCSLRILFKNPGFAFVVVGVLGLGIGANTAMFTLVNAVLLKPLPVRNPDELVMVQMKRPDGINHNFSYPLYKDYRDGNRVFAGIIAFSPALLNFSAGGVTE